MTDKHTIAVERTGEVGRYIRDHSGFIQKLDALMAEHDVSGLVYRVDINARGDHDLLFAAYDTHHNALIAPSTRWRLPGIVLMERVQFHVTPKKDAP